MLPRSLSIRYRDRSFTGRDLLGEAQQGPTEYHKGRAKLRRRELGAVGGKRLGIRIALTSSSDASHAPGLLAKRRGIIVILGVLEDCLFFPTSCPCCAFRCVRWKVELDSRAGRAGSGLGRGYAES